MPDPITTGPTLTFALHPDTNTVDVTFQWSSAVPTNVGRVSIQGYGDLEETLVAVSSTHAPMAIGLQPSTNYIYQVLSVQRDMSTGIDTVVAASNDFTNNPLTFSTPSAIGPISSGPFVSFDVDTAQGFVNATVAWESDIPTNVGRASLLNLGSFDENLSPAVNTMHMPVISGLAPASNFSYQVQSIMRDATTATDEVYAQSNPLDQNPMVFTTPALPPPTVVCLSKPRSKPCVIANGGISTLTINVRKNGLPVPNVLVEFKIQKGNGQLQDASGHKGTDLKVSSNAYGVATINFKALAPKQLAIIRISSAQATNQAVVFVFVHR